ncbi:MAG: hypothetical protein H0W88_06265 [Parachlamydiaceae bacterium]|nr:hypothetical protein [Parachlamydiaceae bacterium]
MLQRYDEQFMSTDGLSTFIYKWTPRAIAGGLAGYYSLGIMYKTGGMAAIDRAAIQVFLKVFGYAGIGAFMPTFQWYAAWSVRICAAVAAGMLFDLCKRLFYVVHNFFSELANPLETPKEIGRRRNTYP